MPASFPGAVKTFASRSNGQTIDASHVQDLQDEVHAIEDGLLNGSAPINSSRITAPALSISAGSTLTTLSVTGGSTFATVQAGASTVTTLSVTGGQIAFPAAQSVSVDANTLDDYEEGTWVPVIGGSGGTSGQTYGLQAGFYVKIGKLVYATCQVTLTNKGTITTNLQLQGLPFASENTSNYNSAGTLSNFVNLSTNWVSLSLVLANGVTAATFQGLAAAGTGQTNLAGTDITNTFTCVATIVYRAAA